MGYIKELGERGVFITPIDERVDVICNSCGERYFDGRHAPADCSDFDYDDVEIKDIVCPKCGGTSLAIKMRVTMRLAVPGPTEEEMDKMEADMKEKENMVVVDEKDDEDDNDPFQFVDEDDDV